MMFPEPQLRTLWSPITLCFSRSARSELPDAATLDYLRTELPRA